MKFIEFEKIARKWGLIDMKNIGLYGNLDKRRLYEWQQNGHITRISNNYYLLSEVELNEQVIRHIANKIYQPSYIGLESALFYYNLIPEQTYQTISITTLKTRKVQNDLINLNYVTVKKGLFWGYELMGLPPYEFFISNLEKTIIDLMYLRRDLKTKTDFLAMRLNEDELRNQLDKKRMKRYFRILNDRRLSQKAKDLLDCYHA